MTENASRPSPLADSVGDYWHLAVKLLTGYHMPFRDRVFDSLIGNAGIPLMSVEISDHDGEPHNAVLDAAKELEAWQSRNSGSRIENTEIVVPFYSGCEGPVESVPPGTQVAMKTARITLLGTSDSHEVPRDGSVGSSTDIRGAAGRDPDRPDAGPTWSSGSLAQYSHGGGKALERLLGTGNTRGFSWSGTTVDPLDAVSLDSFTKAADAIDRAARFFRERHRDLDTWEFEPGTDDAARRGDAAAEFRELVHGLHRTYRRYSEDLPMAGVVDSRYGNDLRRFRDDLRAAAAVLYDSWSVWQEFSGNPLRWLHDLLMEVTQNVWLHNIAKVRYDGGVEGRDSPLGLMTGSHKVASEGFHGGDPSYGALEDPATWKRIGTTAVDRWRKSADEQLGRAGMRALRHVRHSRRDRTSAPPATTYACRHDRKQAGA
ncbi:AAWKG family protein [Streptomyces sp. NPDC048639]|uniref:AAWKG family protein n=1 Tax=Streptomyces sp. NPDC048639 TaxID=3365581 RepID=UPI00370FF8C4